MRALPGKPRAVCAIAASLWLAAGAASAAFSVLSLNNISTVDAAKTLVGCGVTVGDVRYIGAREAAGVFWGGAGILGGTTFDQGLIIASGKAASVIGPNKSDSTGDSFTPDRSDGDLEVLSGKVTHDAAILEFEFTPSSTFVTFDFVFGSDEYNEFTNTSFNDVFAFFMNGVNVALIPGTSTPVAINTVNGGGPSYGTSPSNQAYFKNNDINDGGPFYNTEMDGFTVPITVYATVNANQRNMIRIAIADASDSIYNSWVLIRAGSFASRCPDQVGTTNTSSTMEAGTMVAPNPFRPGSGGAQDSGTISFRGIPGGSAVRVYTPSGVPVIELADSDNDGTVSWDGRNKGGKMLASGVYIWVAKGPDGTTKRGKFMVIR